MANLAELSASKWRPGLVLHYHNEVNAWLKSKDWVNPQRLERVRRMHFYGFHHGVMGQDVSQELLEDCGSSAEHAYLAGREAGRNHPVTERAFANG